jgi:hypothetical protein
MGYKSSFLPSAINAPKTVVLPGFNVLLGSVFVEVPGFTLVKLDMHHVNTTAEASRHNLFKALEKAGFYSNGEIRQEIRGQCIINSASRPPNLCLAPKIV